MTESIASSLSSSLRALSDDSTLLGRVFEVDEQGLPHTAGVITEVYTENDNSLVIIIEQLRHLHFINGAVAWKAGPSKAQYMCGFERATVYTEADGTINISAPYSWTGSILPIGTRLSAVTS